MTNSISKLSHPLLCYAVQVLVVDWKVGMPKKVVEIKPGASGQGSVMFEWIGAHNVWRFRDKDAFETCDFGRAKQLTTRPSFIFTSNPGIYYFGCSVYGHCGSGQKLELVIGDGAKKPGS